MKDPEATASEPLTLDEEYENQQSWRTSHDKLTFIVCQAVDSSHISPIEGISGDGGSGSGARVYAGEADAPDRMVGDINLFLTPWEDGENCHDDDDEHGANTASPDGEVHPSSGLGRDPAASAVSYCNGEVDIMIADHDHRGKGLGISAVSALLGFMRRHLPPILAEYGKAQEDGGQHGREGGVGARHRRYELKDLVAKINASNAGSIALFTRLGFKQKGKVNYFGEIEMVLEGFGALASSSGGAGSGTGGGEAKGDAGADADTDTADYQELVYDRSRLSA
ncbi:hypothetical protein SLS62_002964 [Diatrype stigma]|uniref:N-acetyltransferase domain-containing protein n=1 Tax=Diatrype stigma TaxID=117547 RepID=A0AAN9YUT6_9PEZI